MSPGSAKNGKWLIKGGALLPLLLVLLVTPSSAGVQLLYPEASTYVTKSRHLILKLGSIDIDSVVVTVNGVDSEPLPVGTPEYIMAFKDYLVLQPLWDNGKNQLTVDTFAVGKKLESFKADIFYAPGVEPAGVPKEFGRAVLHRPEIETYCTPCHNMKPTTKQVIDAPDRENACYACHRRMANQKYTHGPVSTFSCVFCHSLQGTPKYEVTRREGKLCFECHKEKRDEIRKFKVLHGPVAADMCEYCHDQHGSDNPMQLRQPVNKLCLSCHENVSSEAHAIAIGGGIGHPVAGKTDPSERGKGRELCCISCHDPHGGPARYYFVTGSENKMDLCQYCHKK